MLHPFVASLGYTLLKIVCLLIAIAYFTIAERKIRAAIQRRRGPNVVGIYGLLQPLADGLKLLAKERVIPSHANSRIFVRAPLVVLTLGLTAWSIIPFGCHDHSEYLSNSNRVYLSGEETDDSSMRCSFWIRFCAKIKNRRNSFQNWARVQHVKLTTLYTNICDCIIFCRLGFALLVGSAVFHLMFYYSLGIVQSLVIIRITLMHLFVTLQVILELFVLPIIEYIYTAYPVVCQIILLAVILLCVHFFIWICKGIFNWIRNKWNFLIFVDFNQFVETNSVGGVRYRLLLILALSLLTAYRLIISGGAAIQRRRGPNAGGVYEFLQPLANGLKLLAKERVIFSHANSRIFVRALLVVFTLGLTAWSIITFGCHDHSEELSNCNKVCLSERETGYARAFCPFWIGLCAKIKNRRNSFQNWARVQHVKLKTLYTNICDFQSFFWPRFVQHYESVMLRWSVGRWELLIFIRLMCLPLYKMFVDIRTFIVAVYTVFPRTRVIILVTVGFFCKKIIDGIRDWIRDKWNFLIFVDFNQLVEINSVGDVRYGLLLILALSSLTVYGLIISGWASNSKYAFLGALRSAAQRISYEVSISLIILPIRMLTGSLNFTEIVYRQQITISNRRPLFPISGIYVVSRIAETNRTPFDLPEAEAELVAGYNVDYSSIIFARFFLAEYGNRIRRSAQKSLIFLGGAGVDLLQVIFNSFIEALLLSIKTLIFCFLFVLVRATFPRYRYDQLRDIGWKTFLPVTTGFFLFITGVLVLIECSPVVYQLKPIEYAESFLLIVISQAVNSTKNKVKIRTREAKTKLNSGFFVFYALGTPTVTVDLTGVASDVMSSQRADVNLESYLAFSFFLYTTGLFGRILNRKNFIVTRRAIELRYLGVITSFVIYGAALNDPRGYVYGLLLVILAACESAVGLGIILVLHRFGGTIDFKSYEELGG